MPTRSGLLILLAAVVLLPPTEVAAKRRDRLTFVRPTGVGCLRAERKLMAFEQRGLASACGRPEGCTARAQRRHTRLVNDATDRCVALNHVQVLGSHNSYHIRPQEPLWSTLLGITAAFEGIDYTHRPLGEQFGEQGIRQIELDVFADPVGGLYAARDAQRVLGIPQPAIPALDQPGLKVLHIQDIDFETTCLTFVECLGAVKAWSDGHPGHLPIMILVEAKDDVLPDVFGVHFAVPIPFGAAEFDAVDADIRSVFPPERLVTPDDVRGGFATLDEAVRTRGWPSLKSTRGRVLFGLDNGGAKRQAYLEGHAALAGRVLFTDADPGDADAAFVKENNPLGTPGRIAELVAAGYVVRTRADADTAEARSGDTRPRDAALASGAQWVSTDYPVENPAFGTGYVVRIPDGMPGRCNPVNAPTACRTVALERVP